MKKLLLTFLVCFLTLPTLAAGPAVPDQTVFQLRKLLHTSLLDECRASSRGGAPGRVEEGDFDKDGLPQIYLPPADQLDAWLTGWRNYFQRYNIPASAEGIRCAWDTSADSFEFLRGAVYTDAAGHACSRIGSEPSICMFVKSKQLCKSVGNAKPTCSPL